MGLWATPARTPGATSTPGRRTTGTWTPPRGTKEILAILSPTVKASPRFQLSGTKLFTFLIRGWVSINTPLSTQHLINTPVVGTPFFYIIGTQYIFGIPFLHLLKLLAPPSIVGIPIPHLLKLLAPPSILGTPSFRGTPSIDTIGTPSRC